MTDSGKGKEKERETMGESSTATTTAADILTSESGTVDAAPTSVVNATPSAEVTAASSGPVEASASTYQTELPSETTEGPSAFAQQINPHVSVDNTEDDTDSALGGDDTASSTTSIASNIMRHRFENGRRYHSYRQGENEYWGPNDEVQNDQLDIAHHMFLILLDQKLHLAPVRDPQRILDLGCGTGIWCIDMAEEYPSAEVLGIDLSPIQPSFTPPNCKFEIDDITLPWTYNQSFDFINIRSLYGSIGDWPALYAQIYAYLVPGGYLHELEMSIQFKSDDGSLKPDHVMSQWSDVFHEASKKFGKSFYEVWNLSTYMKRVGFVDVVERVYKVPVNSWPADPHMKEIGRWNNLHINQGAEGWGLYLLTRVMGWSIEAAQVFIAKFRQGVKERRVHAYFEVVVIHARKPVTGM